MILKNTQKYRNVNYATQETEISEIKVFRLKLNSKGRKMIMLTFRDIFVLHNTSLLLDISAQKSYS